MNKNILYTIALILTVVGGINWGLVGLFDFNLVAAIFSFAPIIVRIIYIVVGISAVYVAIATFSARTNV